MPKLVINPDSEAAWEISLSRGNHLLGRHPENDVALDHSSVSGTHCELIISESGAVIRDLDSSDGTFVDGVRVAESPLQPGQTVRVGEVVMRFESDRKMDESPAPADTPPAANSTCKIHPKAAASYFCPGCQAVYCELCVNTRMVEGRVAKSCRVCGTQCNSLKPAAEPEADGPSYFHQVWRAFLYPIQQDGWILLLGGVVFLVVIKFMARFSSIFGLLVLAFGAGYLVSYLQRILAASATGDAKMPDWPDFSNFEEIFSPILQFIGTVAFSFAPVAILKLTVPVHTPWLGWAMLGGIGLGCIYFPLAFAAVTVFDTLTALNPVVIISSMLKMPLEYSIAVFLLAAGLVMNGFQGALLDRIVPVPILTGLLSEFLSLYLLAVEMRLLGVLCWTKRDQLGWFGRRPSR